MNMKKTNIIAVQGTNIRVVEQYDDQYICLTDIAKKFGGSKLIENWLRNRSTIEFLGVWEHLNNPNFNSLEFEGIKNKAGSNKFLLSVKEWQKRTNAVGVFAKAGKHNSGTYAHRNIALEFCSWLSPEFKLYFIQEFERLKSKEAKLQNLDWDMSRFLASIKYKIQTDAIRDNIIPKLNITKAKESIVYATEADVLNLALFGQTAKEWRSKNSADAVQGNIRDFAAISELIVLSNLESANAKMIAEGLAKPRRLEELNKQAIRELESLKAIGKISNNSKKLGVLRTKKTT
jgi:hypothetical protein